MFAASGRGRAVCLERLALALILQVALHVSDQNARFIVTPLPIEHIDARAPYEDVYCARGDLENRIKEQQMGLFADRASGHALHTNQVRLWRSAFAYVLVDTLRRTALRGTKLECAQAWTLRNRLFKIGALIRVSVRRVRVSLSSAFPYQEIFATARDNLRISFLVCSDAHRQSCVHHHSSDGCVYDGHTGHVNSTFLGWSASRRAPRAQPVLPRPDLALPRGDERSLMMQAG